MPFHITGLPAMATAAATSGPTTLLANNGSAVSPSSFDPAPSSVSVLPTSRILSIVARQDPTIQLRQKIFLENTSPHILLINTHGYAGPKVPMGATDTGGQITYIHRKAVELAKLGYKVTIATRAFRPPPELEEFGTRQGIDFLPGSDGKVRYVFVEGMEEDRASFLPKEGIYADLPAIAHNLAEFIAEEAATAGLSPWEYFTWFESHYVDAGIVGQHLVRIWAHQIAAQYLKERFGPILGEDLSVNSFRKEGNLMGALSYYFGRRVLTLWREEHPGKNQFTAKEILLWAVSKLHWPKSYRATLIEGLEDKSQNAQQLVWEIGNRLMNVAGDTTDLGIILANINRHVFTPHSLGKLKEERMRLSGEAFRERTAFLSMNFPGRERAERSLLSGADILFANLPPSAVVVSTSDEVTDTAYRLGMSPARTLLRFEPGSDEEMYHPRPNMEDPDVSALFHHLEETGVVPKEILDCIRTAPQKFQIIVEAGRMDATKRKHILIRAMTHLPKNTLLFIAGPRDNKGVYDFLSNEIERLELKERVFLLGMLPTPLMGPLMSLPHGKGERQLRLAAVASASRMEGWGMSVQDGTMGGLPLVASSFVPYAVHLDRSRGAAMIVPVIPNDEETEAFGYARAIQNLIDNPDRAADMAAKSREAAREYEWASLTGRFAAQLGSLLSIQDNVIPGRSVSPRVHVVVLQANPSETDSDSPVLENALKKFGPRNVWVAASPESVEAVTARFPDLLQRNIFGIPIRKGTAAAVATAMYRISKQDPRGVALTLPAEYKGDSHFLFSEALRLASDTLANGGLMVFGADEERAIADDNQEVNPYLWGVRSFLRHFSTFQPVRHAALEAVYGRLSTDKPVPKEAIGRYFMPLRHASIRKALISPAQKSGLVTFSPLPG